MRGIRRKSIKMLNNSETVEKPKSPSPMSSRTCCGREGRRTRLRSDRSDAGRGKSLPFMGESVKTSDEVAKSEPVGVIMYKFVQFVLDKLLFFTPHPIGLRGYATCPLELPLKGLLPYKTLHVIAELVFPTL